MRMLIITNRYIKKIIHRKIKVRNIFNQQHRRIIKYPKYLGDKIYKQIRVKKSLDCTKKFFVKKINLNNEKIIITIF